MYMRKWYNRENIQVVALQCIAWVGALLAYDHASSPWARASIVFFFCALMQGVFSMMHECFHGHAHSRRSVNTALGVVASTLFGTAYTLFAVNHHGHHVRNRTRAELVDYIYPDESAAKKVFSYYFAILGGIWLLGAVGSVLCLFLPYSALRLLSRNGRDNTYAAALAEFTPRAWRQMRLEALGLVLFWLGMWYWEPVRHGTIAVCYAAFAFTWSSLQWVYHVRTPLDPVEGAYNLRLPLPMRWLFLNFNYNLTHHRQPTLRWQQLYAASNQQETQPLWYRYLGVFRWPQPLPDDPGMLAKEYF